MTGRGIFEGPAFAAAVFAGIRRVSGLGEGEGEGDERGEEGTEREGGGGAGGGLRRASRAVCARVRAMMTKKDRRTSHGVGSK